RSPETPVHFHQHGLPGLTILFVFEHRRAVPAERPEQTDRLIPQPLVERHAFAQHADASGWGPLPEPPVRERGPYLALIAEDEHAHARTGNAFLDHRRMRGQAIGLAVEPNEI